MKCKTCGREIEDTPQRIVIGEWEYDVETTQKGKSFQYIDIEMPKGAYLWEVSDFGLFTEQQWKDLKLDNEWFFIEQPIKEMRRKGYVARFGAGSDGAVLGCNGDPQVSSSALGVRFKYKVKK